MRYVPGKYMYAADTLSRAYLPGDRSDEQMEDDIEVMVHCLVRDMPVSAMRQELIRAAAAEDPDLQMVRQAAMVGWPKKKHSATGILQDFWPVKDEVHIAEGPLSGPHRNPEYTQ